MNMFACMCDTCAIGYSVCQMHGILFSYQFKYTEIYCLIVCCCFCALLFRVQTSGIIEINEIKHKPKVHLQIEILPFQVDKKSKYLKYQYCQQF